MENKIWVKAFQSKEELGNRLIPNKAGKIELNGLWLNVVYTGKELFAFEENCPHQNFPLVGSSTNDELELICPLHKYKFNLRNGQGHGLSLSCYPVKEHEGSYFIQIPES